MQPDATRLESNTIVSCGYKILRDTTRRFELRAQSDEIGLHRVGSGRNETLESQPQTHGLLISDWPKIPETGPLKLINNSVATKCGSTRCDLN